MQHRKQLLDTELVSGVRLSHVGDMLVVSSVEPLTVVSSAVLGGGFCRSRFIVNAYVDKSYYHADPAQDLCQRLQQGDIRETCVGLMTAVQLDRACVVTGKMDNIEAAVVLTLGLGNATTAGVTGEVMQTPGTINMIVLVDACLTAAAAVNAVITVTEAKTYALLQFGVQTARGTWATGTSTDAVVIAWTDRGTDCSYAGPATAVGGLIARLVGEALAQALALSAKV